MSSARFGILLRPRAEGLSGCVWLRFGLRFVAGLALVLGLLAGCAGSSVAPEGGSRPLVILHTNDFHGHIAPADESAGAARIAEFFNTQRAQHKNVLVLDAGDAISGTPVSTLFSGLPIFEVMNLMGYDLGLVGNHEFDHGWRQIEKFRASVDYPLLAATARGPDGALLGDMPYSIVERGGMRIGVIGVLTETTPSMITPLGNEGTTFASVESTLRSLVAKLRPQVDVLVVLSHTGHEREQALAAAVPGIDVIVGGHSHTRVEQPLLIGKTIVAQAHEYGKAVGVLKLEVVPGGPVKLVQGYLVDAEAMQASDPRIASIVADWEKKVAEQVDFEIAQSSRLIQGAELRNWMERILRERTGADLAYYNAGGVRDAIRPGPVTARTIWNIEPFGNSVVTLHLTGAQVQSLLADNHEDSAIALDQTSVYRLATNSFVGAHLRKTYGDAVTVQDTGLLVRDLLIDAAKSGGLP